MLAYMSRSDDKCSREIDKVDEEIFLMLYNDAVSLHLIRYDVMNNLIYKIENGAMIYHSFAIFLCNYLTSWFIVR